MRFAFSKSPVSVYAISRRLIGSMISPMCGLGFGPRIEYDPACARDWCSGTAWIVAFQVNAFCLPAAFNGKPVKLPSSGPGSMRISRSSSFTIVHEPVSSTICGGGAPAGAWAETEAALTAIKSARPESVNR